MRVFVADPAQMDTRLGNVGAGLPSQNVVDVVPRAQEVALDSTPEAGWPIPLKGFDLRRSPGSHAPLSTKNSHRSRIPSTGQSRKESG